MSEPTVTIRAIPQGYSYVRKGNVFITGNCRKSTQDAHQKVYLVVSPGPDKKPLGIAVPKHIHDDVRAREQETRSQRAAAVDRRDAGIRTDFEKAVRREFPRIPAEALVQVLKTALEKRKGKVGRTGTLNIEAKARLAVRAHIRHGHTLYDVHLRGKTLTQGEARDAVKDQVDTIARSWGKGGPDEQRKPTADSAAQAKGRQRKADKNAAKGKPVVEAPAGNNKKKGKAPNAVTKEQQEKPRQGRTTRSMRSIQQSMQELALRLPDDADRQIRMRDEMHG